MPDFLSRLASQRWTLGAIGAVLALLWWSGRLHGSEAFAAAIFVLAVAFILKPSKRRRLQIKPESNRGPWPEGALRTAIDALPHPTILVDRKQIVRHANDAAGKVLGVRQKGDPIAFRLRWPELLACLETCWQTGGQASIEVKERAPEERWFEVHVRPIQEEGSTRPRFLMLLVEDRTDERRVEQMRVDFIANASHELRTPLAALTGFIETMLGAGRDDAEGRKRFLTMMHAQAGRMARLIDDLLSLNRIEMRAHQAPSTRVDLGGLVREVLALMEPIAARDNVRLVPCLPDGSCLVVGVRDELIQVLSNLIENAVKYGGPDKDVHVALVHRLQAGAKVLEMSVRDEGPGIAAEHLPRLTERFYRVDVGNSRARGGTGLGLAIVKHIALRHRAQLKIESSPGSGATFSLALPIDESDSDRI